MAVEVGSIVEGKITGVKPFGAFVQLPDGSHGMVHISEVSGEYIQQLSDVLNEGQTVKVKVLSISPEGKIALSIKRTVEAQPRAQHAPRTQRADTGRVWQPKASVAPQGEQSFEDMMAQFKTRSEEKIADLKRVTENRRGGGYSRHH